MYRFFNLITTIVYHKVLMQASTRGLLITLEGIDGSGKTTLTKSLAHALQHRGYPITVTREPGGSNLGTYIRSVLQDGTIPVSPKAEYLLFAADRAQHFHDVVIPALENGHIVISDRMADSSLVYQGYGRGLDISMIERINAWTMDNLKPDLTIYVRISTQDAEQRIIARSASKTRFEQETTDFLTKLVSGFDTIFHNASHVLTLDAMQSPEELTRQSMEHITTLISTR